MNKSSPATQKRLLAIAVAATLASTTAVFTPLTFAQAAADADKLDTIVISAQRRDEELQKVPISITTLSAAELTQKQVQRLDDLKFAVPNMVVEPNTGTSSGAKVFMRGVGTDESLFSADPSVAIYIDDVYIPRQTGAMFDLFDVQRIEVLRGPQGTLYGRNATGGAIRYVTVKPKSEAKFEIDGRVGNFGRQDIRASIGGRIGETVDASFAVMTKNRQGYLTDLTNGGNKLNDEQVGGARASFAMPLGKSTKATLTLDTVLQRSGPTYASGIVDAALAASSGRPINNADGNLLTVETNLQAGRNDLDQSGISLVTSTEFDSFAWRNIFAYRKMNNLLYIDLDAAAATRFHLYQDQKQSQTSYESQLVSSGDGPLSWTGGAFLFNEKNDQPTRQDIFAIGGFNYITQKTSAYALYGQGDWRFNPVWKATAGLRYSNETKDFSLLGTNAAGVQTFTLAKKTSWSNTDYRVGIDGQLSDDVLAYGSVTTGFKSGGFNGRAGSVAAFTTLKPETVTAFEIGAKTTLAKGKVRFNFNYYRNDYKDLQLTAFDSNGVSNLTNAASARIQGLEIETVAQLTHEWQVSANLGTIDGKYRDFSAANTATFAGKQLKQAPKQQWGIGTNYRMALSSGTLTFNLDTKRVGDHYQNLANSELIKTKAYALTDARLNYEVKGGAWSVSVWGKNLGNKLYYTGGFDISGLVIADAYINVPRTTGLDFRYKFW